MGKYINIAGLLKDAEVNQALDINVLINCQ